MPAESAAVKIMEQSLPDNRIISNFTRQNATGFILIIDIYGEISRHWIDRFSRYGRKSCAEHGE
jgi:hypothetical protein